MATQSYAERISQAEVMLSGLKNNRQQLEKRGIDQAFIDKMTADTADAVRLNNEQEALKAQLKVKTAELSDKMKELS